MADFPHDVILLVTNLVIGEEVIQLERGADAASDLRRSLAGGQGVLFWQLARELLRSQAATTRDTINNQPRLYSAEKKQRGQKLNNGLK